MTAANIDNVIAIDAGELTSLARELETANAEIASVDRALARLREEIKAAKAKAYEARVRSEALRVRLATAIGYDVRPRTFLVSAGDRGAPLRYPGSTAIVKRIDTERTKP